MKAKLYLGDISQEKIRPERIKGITVAEYFRRSDTALVICCDAFCCILDCSKPEMPGDVLINPGPDDKPWAPELVLRKESFGGLLWNRKTGHVWEIDRKATQVCLALANGKSLKEVGKKHGVSESDLFSLLAEVTQQL